MGDMALKIVATKKTSALAGIWTGIGMSAFEAWTQKYPQDVFSNRFLFVAAVVVFFYGPLFFVCGPLRRRFGVRHVFIREYWGDYPQALSRVLCWFLGAVASVVLYSLVRYGQWPVETS
jgi:hypothetical protein